MKKRHLNSLTLKKRAISYLNNFKEITGGRVSSDNSAISEEYLCDTFKPCPCPRGVKNEE